MPENNKALQFPSGGSVLSITDKIKQSLPKPTGRIEKTFGFK